MTQKSGKSALKINKDSHLIKKASSSVTTTTTKPQQRQPVIIYTHSPRIIQTHPSNFMELVQKLTGLSHSDEANDDVACKQPSPPKEEPEENEVASSSVMTAEDLDGYNCVGSEVKSSFVTLEAPPPIIMPDYVNMFGNIGTHFLCSNKPIYNFADPSMF